MSDCSSSPDLSHSPYLSGLIERFGAPDASTAEAAIAALDDGLTPDCAAPDLSALKAQFNLGWSYLALNARRPFPELGRLQSAFADKAVQCALNQAWQEQGLAGAPEGVFILGLGKLGGHDLNFSSDIDLIAYYDPDIVPVSQAKGQAYVLGKVMQRLTRIMMPVGNPDFVYRVDWRLRPEASATGLAMSVTRAQDFYFFRALPWHRLALIKARVVAGDQARGAEFLKTMAPFLWRQNLDFRTIDELADLKRRITLEHPRLKAERAAPQPIQDRPTGFNVKLGAGGIREIEFMANAQQMIWGGKHYPLRTTQTLMALEKLGELGLIKPDQAVELSAIYMRHRRVENALQMLRNGHEHVLPAQMDDMNPLAALMGQDLAQMSAQMTADRHYAHEMFGHMFSVTGPKDKQLASDETATLSRFDITDLSDASQTILESWRQGFGRYGARASKRSRLTPLSAALVNHVSTIQDKDAAVQRIDRFLGSLSRSEQYLSLLAAHPALLDALIRPILYSPHMSVLLDQSPHIIDTFLDPAPADASFVLAEADYETRLERLRRFVNEGLFQSYNAFLSRQIDWRDLAAELTRLAETAIETALQIARDDLKAPDLKIAVLGLGKLGQSLMAPESDIDLVFLFEDTVDRDLATKAVRRLTTILTTPLREGIAYELDTRLRPSGRSGPPAVTLSAFRKHHDSAARTWEHIALVPARIVAGDAALGAAVTRELRSILERPRDPAQLFADAHAMWQKITDERITAVPEDHFGTKLREGGLMMADFWDSVAILSGMPRLEDERLGWSEWLYWERLLGLTGRPISAVPKPYQAAFPDDLPALQAGLQARVIKAVAALPDPEGLETMQPVKWTGET